MFSLPAIWSGMGCNGIAVATIVSHTSVMVYIVLRIFQRDVMQSVQPETFRPIKDSFKQILVLLVPASSALIIMVVYGFVVQFAPKAFGGHAVAAYGVALRIE